LAQHFAEAQIYGQTALILYFHGYPLYFAEVEDFGNIVSNPE